MAAPDFTDEEFMKKINELPAIANILSLAAQVDKKLLTPEEAHMKMEREIGPIKL